MSTQPLAEVNAQAAAEIARLDACRATLEAADYLAPADGMASLLQASFALTDRLRGRQEKGLDAAEQKQLEVVAQCADLETWHLLASDGPLWFRGYAAPRSADDDSRWSDEVGGDLIATVLDNVDAKHVVVGHTPQLPDGIGVRFDGRIFLIDTGMLTAVYQGRPAALELEDGVFTAIYLDQREKLLETTAKIGALEPSAQPQTAHWSWRGPDGRPLPFSSPKQLEAFLRSADLVEREVIDSGVTRPTKMLMEKDGVRANAIFRSVDLEVRNRQAEDGRRHRWWRDSFAYECAAYELAEALGLPRVPPVVKRSLGGQKGSLQAWVEDAMREADRLERKLTPPEPLRWARMQLEMRLFDALINNQDRHEGNSLIDEDWNLWFIDHTRSFLVEHGESAIAELQRVPESLWDRLQTADREELEQRLTAYLSPAERRALFERWDHTLQRFRTLAAQRGAANVFLE